VIWRDQIFNVFGLFGRAALAGRTELNVGLMALTLALTFLLPWLLRRLLPAAVARKIPVVLVVLLLVTLAGLPLQRDIALTDLGGDCAGPEGCAALTTEAGCASGGAGELECEWVDAVIGSFGDFADILERNVPWGSWASDPVQLWVAAPFVLELTLLAYLDTILTVLVVDKLLRAKRVWDQPTAKNRELVAQGVGNTLCAFVGGVPGAQSTTVSVLNINEGGTNRIAGGLVGVFVLLEMLLLQNVIGYIPAAVFSGILFKVGLHPIVTSQCSSTTLY
jgi:SulP family sulfate permease